MLCSIICSLWHLIIVTSCFWVLWKTADSPQLLKSDHSVLPFVSDLFSNLCLTFPGTECLLCFRSRQKTSLKPFVSAGRLVSTDFPLCKCLWFLKGSSVCLWDVMSHYRNLLDFPSVASTYFKYQDLTVKNKFFRRAGPSGKCHVLILSGGSWMYEIKYNFFSFWKGSQEFG